MGLTGAQDGGLICGVFKISVFHRCRLSADVMLKNLSKILHKSIRQKDISKETKSIFLKSKI